jgi:hypothetical protein
MGDPVSNERLEQLADGRLGMSTEEQKALVTEVTSWRGVSERIVWTKTPRHDGYYADAAWLGIGFTDDERDLLNRLIEEDPGER